MKIKCACKKYETELPYVENDILSRLYIEIDSNVTRIHRYKAIKHDVNKCKAV